MSQRRGKHEEFNIGYYLNAESGQLVIGLVGNDEQGRYVECSGCGKKIYGNTYEQVVSIPSGPVTFQQFYCSTGCFQKMGELYRSDKEELSMTLMDYLIMTVLSLWRDLQKAESRNG
jgi:hypothetical protein